MSEAGEGYNPDINFKQNKETKISLESKFSDSLGVETVIIFDKDNEKSDTIRVYRGIRGFFNKNILDEQTSNMMRFMDQNRDIRINQEIADSVEKLALEPTPENYKKVINESKTLGLNNFMIENPQNFYEDFKSNLITQHRNAVRGDTGSSPWIATTSNLLEAFDSTGFGLGAILVIDVPRDRITLSQHTDENEILINGYLKKEEISAAVLLDKTKITKSMTDEEKSEEFTNLIQELNNHLH